MLITQLLCTHSQTIDDVYDVHMTFDDFYDVHMTFMMCTWHWLCLWCAHDIDDVYHKNSKYHLLLAYYHHQIICYHVSLLMKLYIFRCCVYLSELEHQFFSHTSGYQSFPPRFAPPSMNSEKSGHSASDDIFRYSGRFRLG